MIEQMSPTLKKRYNIFAGLMAEARVPFGLNEVLRTKIRQLAYAAQGRTTPELKAMCEKYQWSLSLSRVKTLEAAGKTPQEICDIFRQESNLAPLKGREWYVVTKTLNSRHFANDQGLSDAFDIKIFRPGNVPTWDTKYDADMDGIPEYLEAARIGKKAGLDAGGLWTGTFRDWPHFNLPR